jgi:hypothetical protein
VQSTSAILDAESGVVSLGVDTRRLADVLDLIASYEQHATACSTAMVASEDVAHMASAIAAALDSVDAAHAARQIATRASDAELTRAALTAAAIGIERSAEACGAHADHHDHCRLHSGAARETAASVRSLIGELGG